MSTYWDVKCLDCDEVCDLGETNHAVDEVRSLIRHANVIASLLPLQSELITPEFRFRYQCSIPVDWFAKHKEHNIVPYSEYGEIDGTCGQHFHCPECGHLAHCDLEKGHPGKHRVIHK